MTIEERFKQFEDDFLKFQKVEGKRSERPDLHAFILLDEILPGTGDIVSGAEHDEIYLSVDLEDLDKRATDDHIQELVRCGVMISEFHCLSMFV